MQTRFTVFEIKFWIFTKYVNLNLMNLLLLDFFECCVVIFGFFIFQFHLFCLKMHFL